MGYLMVLDVSSIDYDAVDSGTDYGWDTILHHKNP